MPRSRSEPRVIDFSDGAIDDIKWQRITRGDLRVVVDELKRIAVLPNVEIDAFVMCVHCTDDEWMRLKITRPKQIRVFFTIENDDTVIMVQGIMYRSDNTYAQVELIWRAQNQRAYAGAA